MPRKTIRRAEGRPLTERGRIALLWLDELTEPRPADARYDYGEAAWKLGDRLDAAGLGHVNRRSENGAANVLVGLKRRGFADNNGGGAWLSANWWITDEGQQAAKALRAVKED